MRLIKKELHSMDDAGYASDELDNPNEPFNFPTAEDTQCYWRVAHSWILTRL